MLMKYNAQIVCLKVMHKKTELTQFAHTLYSFYSKLYEKLTIINKNQYLNTKLML